MIVDTSYIRQFLHRGAWRTLAKYIGYTPYILQHYPTMTFLIWNIVNMLINSTSAGIWMLNHLLDWIRRPL